MTKRVHMLKFRFLCLRLMLPYEEHLRAGGAEFKVPESPVVPKPRGIRGRRPHPRGKKPGPRPRERKVATPPAAASPTMHDDVSLQLCFHLLLTLLNADAP